MPKITNLKDKLFTCALLALCLALYWALQLPCPMLRFAGIPCPGCGMSRAYLRLLRLDVRGAFEMHSMFWAIPLLLAYYLFDGRLFRNRLLNNSLLSLICAGFLVHWLVQLL